MDTNEAILRLLAADHRVRPAGPNQLRTSDDELIEVRRTHRSPSRAAIHADLSRVADDAVLLYVVDRIGPALEELAGSNPRLAAASPDRLWFGGRLSRPEPDPEPRRPAGKGPRPYGRFAVARALLAGTPLSQRALAEHLGITQPAVSNALRRLAPLVVKTTDGWEPADRKKLFRYAADEYPGAAGITTYWWHDSDLEGQLELVTGTGEVLLLSGDLAARRISAWRRPEHVVLYTEGDVDPAGLGFALATRDDHTLELTIPVDPTIWATADLFGRPGLADPVIVARDIRRTGRTGDEGEAADAIARTVVG